MKKFTSAVLTAAMIALAVSPAYAEGTEQLITGPAGFPFTFQPNPVSGITSWVIDNGTNGYGESEHYTDYSSYPMPEKNGVGLGNDFSEDLAGRNFVYHATLNPASQSGSRYINILFSPGWRIQPGYTFYDSKIARIEFDWCADITGTDNTMDTYFIGRGGVKCFGLRATYHANSNAEPWNSTISFLSGASDSGESLLDPKQLEQEREQEWYHALLAANQWYRVSVTVDFETQRILKVTYRRYDADADAFETKPAITLRDMPFIDSDTQVMNIGAVRLESVRNNGDIEIDWNVDNFSAYEVLSGFYLTKLIVRGGDGEPVSEAEVTIIGEDFTGEYLTDENGQVQFKIEPGTYNYVIKKGGYETEDGDDDAEGSIEVTADGTNEVAVIYKVREYDYIPTEVTISGGQSSLTAPHSEEYDSHTSAPYTLTVKDQEGIEHTDYDVRWAIEPSDDYVDIDEYTGAVTVLKGFDGGANHIKKFTVTPTVTIGDNSGSPASTEIEISDYLFYDSGVNGSSYGDADTPPEAHQIGEDGIYITTSEGGKDNGRRDYVGVINLPEPVIFEPNTVHEVSFDTTIVTHDSTSSFGRSAIFASSDNLNMVALDYINMEIGEHTKTDDDSTWTSGVNTLEKTYGAIDNLGEWKHVSLLFETDDEGVTTASVTIGDTTTDLGVMEAEVIVDEDIPDESADEDIPEGTAEGDTEDVEIADEPLTETVPIKDLAKIKITVNRVETPTDRFAAFKNFIIRNGEGIEKDKYISFDVPEEYIGTDAILIKAQYDGGVLTGAKLDKITFSAENVVEGKYSIIKEEIEPETTVMLWTADKYTPFGPAQYIK